MAGNADAGSALASLTTAAGGDLSKMEAAEQNGLLMEVLQQVRPLQGSSQQTRVIKEGSSEISVRAQKAPLRIALGRSGLVLVHIQTSRVKAQLDLRFAADPMWRYVAGVICLLRTP